MCVQQCYKVYLHSSVRSIREAYKDKENDFDFKLFSVPEVQQALQKINSKKSSGWDFTEASQERG